MKRTSLASPDFDLSGEESDVLFQDTLKMIFLKYVNPILFFYFPLSILKKCAIIILIISCIGGEWWKISCVSQ